MASKSLLAGLLSVVAFAPPAAVAAPQDGTPSVPSRKLDDPVPQATEQGMSKAPAVVWPAAGEQTVDLATDTTSTVPEDSPPAGSVSVVSVRAAEPKSPALTRSELGAASGEVDLPPSKVDVQVLDHHKAEAAGGLGLAVRVYRADGGTLSGPAEISIDYSKFANAYGGGFAGRLRLLKLPACAATTPEVRACRKGEYVDAVNDTRAQRLTATVEAAPQQDTDSGLSTMSYATTASTTTDSSVYTLTTGSSSDEGDYRASPMSPSGKWDVSRGSGAFTYSVPIQVPAPPVGNAPGISFTYNSQSIDGRTSASNNQASAVGMGWEMNAGGFIERRYKNCSQDGLPTIGDLCWASPNPSAEPSGAVYVIHLGGVSSELVQDNNGTGSYHLKDDPGWRVQRLTHDSNDWSQDYWVISHQDGTRYYFGWGKSQRSGEATNSTLRVPVVGNDSGEPCHGQFPEPCDQTWRWNLDRVVTPNEVETAYFYDKDTNYYRSVAASDKAREYDSAGYLTRIEYGWSSQISNAQLPAKVDFTYYNRCVERMDEKDPLDNTTPSCPTIDSSPSSYPDVPVDLICDGSSDDYACAGKTYYPTFFERKMLWDIKTYVRDNDAASWDLVMRYQLRHALMNPSGSVDGQLWLDYIQRRGYSGTDITLPTLNFNGEWQDNLVGSGELNFRRINKVYTDTGSTISVTYGHATDAGGTISRQCDANNLPSQSDNHYECFWQKWTPEGETTAKTGWFKKFVVTRVDVDPGDLADGDPQMTTTYEYDGAPGWRFTADPLVDDEDETWSDWRGYGKVLVTTGAGSNKHSTYTWLYRGLDGDRTSKTDSSQTRSVDVTDSEGATWTDSPWLAGRTLETSVRDDNGTSQQRVWHKYWVHDTAQYTGLPDARFVRESETRAYDKLHTSTSDLSTWREHVVQHEYDDNEAASTTFGLPMRIDDWGESGVSDNQCTEFGRAYNTSTLDSTGTQRWMVYQDDVRHYTVGCTTQAQDQANGQDTLHQDQRTVTYYDGATSFTDNNTALVDGNPTEVRAYTDATHYRKITHAYDAAGRVTKTWDGKQNLTTTTYAPATSWPVNGVTTTTPDPDGTGPAAAMTSTTYLSRYFAKPWKIVNANGNTTHVVYDAVGRVSKVFKPTETANYPDGNPSMKFAYSIPVADTSSGVPDEATGEPLKATSQVLQSGSTYTEAVAYTDGLGRARETQVPAPSGTGRTVTTTRYDSSGNVAGASSPFYNSGSAGSGLVNPAVSDIPSYGDVQVDWAGRTTLSQIQVNGVVQATGKTTTAYDGADKTTVTPPEGGATDTYTDVYGHTTQVVEHNGSSAYTTHYAYTRSGKLKQVTDTKGNVTTYGYDWAGDRTSTNDPDTGASSTTYDENGNVGTATDNGTTLTYQYDNLGRQTAVSQGSTLLSQTAYDTAPGGLGRLASSTSYANGKAYTQSVTGYDDRGRATGKKVTVPDDGSGFTGSYTFGYGYDLADHMTSVSYPAVGGLPAETVTTTYTAQGRPSKVSSPLATYQSSIDFDHLGRLNGRAYGTSGGSDATVNRAYAYNDTNGTGALAGIQTTVTAASTTTTAQDDTYSRDLGGQITGITDGVTQQSECYKYDDLDRLTQAWTTQATDNCTGSAAPDLSSSLDPYDQTYTYDALGNLMSIKDTTASGTTTKTYHYPGYSTDNSTYTPGQAHPHAVTQAGSDTFTYNTSGQMTSRTVGGVTSTLDWNPQNRVNQITQHKTTGDETSTYVYDAGGTVLLRTSPQENVLYLDGHELHKAAGGSVKATRMYSAAGTTVAMRQDDGTSDGKLTWLLSDTQASTSLLIAADGTVTRRRYTPFGKQRGSTDLPSTTDRGFLGKPEDDSTGLSILGARMYDPTLGRFISPDELTSPYDPQGLSGYSYSGNNPIAFSDPSGLHPVTQCDGGCSSPGDQVYRDWMTPNGDGTWGYHYENTVYNYSNTGAVESAAKAGSDLPYGKKVVYKPQGTGVGKFLKVIAKAIYHASGLSDGVGCVTDPTWGQCLQAGALITATILSGGEDDLAIMGARGLEEGVEGEVAGDAARLLKNCSFSPDTKVVMGSGKAKPIGKIKVGDKVQAADPENGKHQGARTVQHVWINHDHDLLDLTIRTKDGHTATLHTTANHPFWDDTTHTWVPAGALHHGDALNTPTNHHAYVITTHVTPGAANRWNLTVQQLHTYYVLAGQTPVLVHNTCSSNAKILGENMEAAGTVRPPETAAHHIVASTSPKAAAARQQLAKFGIDINDADNGVFLPRGSASVNPSGASVHSRIHTNDYYTYVNDMIGGARNAGEARDVLGYLRSQLQGGYWP
ncbi:RHS repeat-associated core domain-containing protein [Streptomyces pluripotens]|uniref:RHS repeat-associated core domain-containing protein n=1 Tax=Streptomyces pluripotens TaxID=1355015 RepID=UPI00131E9AE6|nr:RHS repeat-associated core domain-containing protein [Streptomyces pluripotens]